MLKGLKTTLKVRENILSNISKIIEDKLMKLEILCLNNTKI